MIFTVLFIFSFTAILVSSLVQIGQQNLQNEQDKWANSLATNIAINTRSAAAEKDSKTLQGYLQGIMTQTDLLYAAILDDDGSILAIIDSTWMFHPQLQDLSAKVMIQTVIADTTMKGSIYSNFVTPFAFDADGLITEEISSGPPELSRKERNGNAIPFIRMKVVLGISPDNMFEKIDAMRDKAITIAGISALVILLVVLWSVQSITTPLKTLAKATQRVAAGDFNQFIKNQRQDELGVLASSFNQMIVRLRMAKTKEKEYTSDLEKIVEERTKALRESEGKYRTLFEHSATAVTWFGEDETLYMVNQSFEKLSGYTKTEVERQLGFLDFFTEKDRKKIRENYLGRRSDDPISYDCTFIDRFSNPRKVNLTLSTVPMTNHILASIADITELHELQQRLIHSEHLAAIGELSASIAHEIRNPLGAINTSIGILKNDLKLTGEQKELMGIISEESMRLKQIIEDFLQFTHPHKPHFQATNINSILHETLLLFKGRINHGISQELYLAEDLPLIQVDPNQVKQVIINIIINAIDMMPGGGVISFTTRYKQNQFGSRFIEILCRDTGKGIHETDMNKVFQPFYSTKENGTGMGLAICQRIIQNHGGEIKVESKYGEGTQFMITLPIIDRTT